MDSQITLRKVKDSFIEQVESLKLQAELPRAINRYLALYHDYHEYFRTLSVIRKDYQTQQLERGVLRDTRESVEGHDWEPCLHDVHVPPSIASKLRAHEPLSAEEQRLIADRILKRQEIETEYGHDSELWIAEFGSFVRSLGERVEIRVEVRYWHPKVEMPLCPATQQWDKFQQFTEDDRFCIALVRCFALVDALSLTEKHLPKKHASYRWAEFDLAEISPLAGNAEEETGSRDLDNERLNPDFAQACLELVKQVAKRRVVQPPQRKPRDGQPRRIWELLQCRSMDSNSLARALRTKPGAIRQAIRKLRDAEFAVCHRPGVGYYREDAPPDWNA